VIARVALFSMHSSPLATVGSTDVGGMNVHVRRLADEMSRRGIRVDVFTRRTDAAAPSIMRTTDGTRIVQLCAGPRREVPKSVLPLHIPSMASAFLEFTKRECISYDVLHSHYWISGLVALRAQCQVGAPVLHMFHTLSKVKELYAGGLDVTDSALRSDGERQVAGCADRVIGATGLEKEQLEKLYGVGLRSFSVIPPGVDMDLFSPRRKSDSRQQLGVQGKHVILFVGRPDRIKGLDLLLNSVKKLDPTILSATKLLIVGEAEPEPRGRYARMVENLNLGDVVEFRGIVPQCQLPLYYSAADVCAMPSVYESFGMVAIEALACQTPVVGFKLGGVATTVRNGNTGFLAKPGDADDLAAQLDHALQSHRLGEMGRAGRLSVRKYQWSMIVERTLDLYEEVVTERPRLASSLA
jgi:D-inositol-3-phosphate glycosyltransferase